MYNMRLSAQPRQYRLEDRNKDSSFSRSSRSVSPSSSATELPPYSTKMSSYSSPSYVEQEMGYGIDDRIWPTKEARSPIFLHPSASIAERHDGAIQPVSAHPDVISSRYVPFSRPGTDTPHHPSKLMSPLQGFSYSAAYEEPRYGTPPISIPNDLWSSALSRPQPPHFNSRPVSPMSGVEHAHPRSSTSPSTLLSSTVYVPSTQQILRPETASPRLGTGSKPPVASVGRAQTPRFGLPRRAQSAANEGEAQRLSTPLTRPYSPLIVHRPGSASPYMRNPGDTSTARAVSPMGDQSYKYQRGGDVVVDTISTSPPSSFSPHELLHRELQRGGSPKQVEVVPLALRPGYVQPI